MKILTLSIVLFLACITAHGQVFSFEFEGIDRVYKVHLPPDYSPDSLYPMVFNLHGLGSNGIEQQLYSGFDFVADTAGIIVVYPDGVDNQWTVYGSAGPNDVGFISALIDTMAAHYSIDLDRVYSTGMSMGGFMSYRLACELDLRIAAIASVTGLLVTSPCEPSRPFPILQMHGTADPVVPYSGVPITISYWTLYNNCPPDPVVTDLPDIDTNDNSTVTLSYYGPCDDLTEVILYTINGGEHTWPGSVILIGITNQDINGSVEIWNFFKNYTLDGYTEIEGPEKDVYSLNIYPNPFSGYATLDVQGPYSKEYEVRIIDITGKVLKQAAYTGEKRQLIDATGLETGIYFLEMTGDNGRGTTKFIVQ
jgi:polyhydroxybutyrate depolymerase